jgi:hypothetical protein
VTLLPQSPSSWDYKHAPPQQQDPHLKKAKIKTLKKKKKESMRAGGVAQVAEPGKHKDPECKSQYCQKNKKEDKEGLNTICILQIQFQLVFRRKEGNTGLRPTRRLW